MADPDIEASAAELRAVTRDLFKYLRFQDRDVVNASGLSAAQSYALEAIGDGEAPTVSAVAQALFIVPSTATRLVDELVRKELVVRATDPNDRRAIRLTLTDYGDGLYRALRAHFLNRQRAILAQLDSAGRRTVVTVLRKLYEAVRDPTCCAIAFQWPPGAEPAPAGEHVRESVPVPMKSKSPEAWPVRRRSQQPVRPSLPRSGSARDVRKRTR